MKIKIIENARLKYIARCNTFNPINWKWADLLEQIQGMILDVETEYLFKDQYNTAPIENISDTGIRIMDYLVEEVIDDQRPGKARCQWCGKVSNDVNCCEHCKKTEYLTKF